MAHTPHTDVTELEREAVDWADAAKSRPWCDWTKSRAAEAKQKAAAAKQRAPAPAPTPAPAAPARKVKTAAADHPGTDESEREKLQQMRDGYLRLLQLNPADTSLKRMVDALDARLQQDPAANELKRMLRDKTPASKGYVAKCFRHFTDMLADEIGAVIAAAIAPLKEENAQLLALVAELERKNRQ